MNDLLGLLGLVGVILLLLIIENILLAAHIAARGKFLVKDE